MGILRNSDLKRELEKLQRIKSIWDNPQYNEAIRKASRMSTHAMLSWIENSVNGMGKAVMDYSEHGEIASLLELKYAISVLQALTEELIIKHENS